MENSLSRILIETTVRQTLKGLQENPKRSTRNLIDMALQFSEGRFQSHFFETAQTLLKNEDSAYYALVQDTASHIETEHMVKFGMNLGYNSCTWGAQQIRLNEKRLGFNIPWAVLFRIESFSYAEHQVQYDNAIADGEQLGIYSWILLTHGDPSPLLPLVQKHSDSAFFLLCDPEGVTEAFLDTASQIKHLMLVVRFCGGAERACAMLRGAQLPYAVYCPYSQKDVEGIVNGTLFEKAQQLHPVFTVLVPERGCPDSIRHVVYQTVVAVRNGQTYQTIPWELLYDTRKIDEIISDDACCAFFDSQGNLYVPDDLHAAAYGNLFADGLPAILQQAYPKTVPAPTT